MILRWDLRTALAITALSILLLAVGFFASDLLAGRGFWGLSPTDWLTIVAVLVPLVGFVVTIVQVTRTRRAVTSATGAIRGANMVASLTSLLGLEQELEDAILANDDPRTREVLGKWRRASSEVRGIAEGDDEVNAALSQQLQDSFVISLTAQRDLDDGAAVGVATADIRGAVRNVSGEISRVVGRLKMRGSQ